MRYLLLTLLIVAGCHGTTIEGAKEAHYTHIQSTDFDETFIRQPDGTTEFRVKRAATTQKSTSSSQDKTVHTTGLLSYDADGNIEIKADVVAQRFKAVWLPCVGLLLLGGFLCFLKRWDVGLLLIVAGFAVMAFPEVALIAFIIAVVFVLFLNWKAIKQLIKSHDHAVVAAVADNVITKQQASEIKGYQAEKTDSWVQKLQRT